MRHVQIEFLLVHFTAQSATAAADIVGRIASQAAEFDAITEQLLGTLVLVHHGAHESSREFERAQLVARILEQVPEARVIHGRAPGSCGNFGNDRRLFYGVTFLGSHYALARVLELPPGASEDFTD